MQHAVVVSISDQEPAIEDFQSKLDSRRDKDLAFRRIIYGERAKVCDNGETIWTVNPVNTNNRIAFRVEVTANHGDQHISGLADEGDIDCPTDRRDRLRQTAGERRDRPALRINL